MSDDDGMTMTEGRRQRRRRMTGKYELSKSESSGVKPRMKFNLMRDGQSLYTFCTLFITSSLRRIRQKLRDMAGVLFHFLHGRTILISRQHRVYLRLFFGEDFLLLLLKRFLSVLRDRRSPLRQSSHTQVVDRGSRRNGGWWQSM